MSMVASRLLRWNLRTHCFFGNLKPKAGYCFEGSKAKGWWPKKGGQKTHCQWGGWIFHGQVLSQVKCNSHKEASFSSTTSCKIPGGNWGLALPARDAAPRGTLTHWPGPGLATQTFSKPGGSCSMVGRAKAAKLNDSNSVLSLRSRQDSMSYAAMRCRVTKPWLSKRWRSSSSSGVVIELGHSRFWASHSQKTIIGT